MRIAGIVLILVGVASLLRNIGFTSVIIWSVLAIVVGIMLKQGCGHVRCGGMGFCCDKDEKCGNGKKCGSHVCSGPECAECKK